jgi:hypothetical protein
MVVRLSCAVFERTIRVIPSRTPTLSSLSSFPDVTTLAFAMFTLCRSPMWAAWSLATVWLMSVGAIRWKAGVIFDRMSCVVLRVVAGVWATRPIFQWMVCVVFGGREWARALSILSSSDVTTLAGATSSLWSSLWSIWTLAALRRTSVGAIRWKTGVIFEGPSCVVSVLAAVVWLRTPRVIVSVVFRTVTRELERSVDERRTFWRRRTATVAPLRHSADDSDDGKQDSQQKFHCVGSHKSISVERNKEHYCFSSHIHFETKTSLNS